MVEGVRAVSWLMDMSVFEEPPKKGIVVYVYGYPDFMTKRVQVK